MEDGGGGGEKFFLGTRRRFASHTRPVLHFECRRQKTCFRKRLRSAMAECYQMKTWGVVDSLVEMWATYITSMEVV